jgi:hypothetical protein
MSEAMTPEAGQEMQPVRKAWVTPAIIVSAASDTEAHVTRFTDGTDTGGNHSQYGS